MADMNDGHKPNLNALFYADTRQDARNYKKEIKEMDEVYLDYDVSINPKKSTFTKERPMTVEEKKSEGLTPDRVYWCFYVN